MAGFLSTKMKRKDLEEVNDDFSEFSLSSPPRKIRRLDVELPPIMEEEEPAASLFLKQQLSNEQMSTTISTPFADAVIGTVPPVPLNEERALVLYMPVNPSMVVSPSPSSFSLKVSSDLIPSLKGQAMWGGNQNPVIVNGSSSNSLAVVPWMPSQYPMPVQVVEDARSRDGFVEEPMEAEEAEGSSMEVEEERGQAPNSGVGGEGFQQWPQHCLTPELLPTSTSTPIMWS